MSRIVHLQNVIFIHCCTVLQDLLVKLTMTDSLLTYLIFH